MIVPGLKFTGSQVNTTRSAGQAATTIQQGFGFMADGSLAIDTNAVPTPPASNTKGFSQNSTGAIYGTTVQSATDSWVEGVRVSAAGAIVFESAAAANFASGNPITAAGNFAVSP